MALAVKLDHKAIEEHKGPAVNRVKLLKEVDSMLRKKHVQLELLDMNGLEVIASWLSENPDGSYPLPQVVECVFDILERLPIDTRHLEASKIAKVVSLYKYLEPRALAIIQKW